MKNFITEILCYNSSRLVIFSSIFLAIVILFYPLSVGSYFEPDIYRFEDRTTFHQYFKGNYIFSQLIDNIVIVLAFLGWFTLSFENRKISGPVVSIIGLSLIFSIVSGVPLILQALSVLSLPIIISIYAVNRKIGKRLLREGSGLKTINYFLMAFLILALASIFASGFDSNLSNPFIDIITLFSRFAPVLMLLIVFTAMMRLITNQDVLVPTSIRKSAVSFLISPFGVQDYQNISRTKNMTLLSTFMALSILIVIIPHLGGGPLYKVGEDTTPYSEMMLEMKKSSDAEQFLLTIFTDIQSGDRPFSLVILYILLTISSNNVILAFEVILPALLAPLLVLSIYLLSKELSGSSLVALSSSFVTAVSFQIMIGVYAGLYANWIALVIGCIAIWFAVRYINKAGKLNLVAFSISMLALLLSHSYTWTIFTTFLILFLLLLRWRKLSDLAGIRNLLVIIACIIAVDFIKGISLESLSAAQLNVSVANAQDLGLISFGDRWSVLVRTVEVFLGGIFGNVVVLLLIFYFIIMFKFKNTVGYFCTVFLSLGMIAIIFGDKVVQSRILYDIPFQIPAGLALSNIFVSKNGKLKTAVIGASLLAIAIYTMTNLGVSPR